MSPYRYADHPVADRSELVKIRIPLPAPETFRGEYVWALPLGGDVYRIENVVFYDAEIGLHDEVVALDAGDGLEHVEVVRRRTHVRFTFHLPNRSVLTAMDALPCRGEVAIEGASHGHFVANLPDRTVATEFQAFLEAQALWFERVDGIGEPSVWDDTDLVRDADW